MKKTDISKGHKRRARWVAAVALGVFSLAAVFAGAGDSLRAWAITLTPELFAIKKLEVVQEDNNKIAENTRKANVLFYLDTSAPMIFSPKGKLPQVVLRSGGTNPDGTVADWPATLARYGKTKQDIIEMMKYCTFGTGTLPFRKNNNVQSDSNHYGRDVDDGNNLTPGNTNLADPRNMYNYYSPFDRPNNELGAQALPYALVFKSPNHWRIPPASFTKDDLVPNDSRIYKMKTVMWHLLSETQLFENIRFGMATAFSAPSNGRHLLYKVPTYGHRNATGVRDYIYGVIGHYNTGQHYNYNAVDSQVGTWGIPSSVLDPTYSGWQVRNFANRAYLRVPIADYTKTWMKGSGSDVVKKTQTDMFRMWIDGLEDVYTGGKKQFYHHKQPELKASGLTPLAMSIFPDPSSPRTNRQWYIGNRGIQYSYRYDRVVSNKPKGVGSSPLANHNYKGNSGEAVGSVIDFFSPPTGNSDGGDFNEMDDVSFPIRDVCEPNWLVVFTSGNDSIGYQPHQAVKALYDHTKNDKVSVLEYGTGGNRRIVQKKLDRPIRTIVVGFVDPDSQEPDAVALRAELQRMAREGDPENAEAKPYFANDVPGLIRALKEIMNKINTELQPSGGAMAESGSLEDQTDEKDFNLFATKYRIRRFDQWEGNLTRYETAKNQEGDITMTSKWELNSSITAQRDSSAGSRNLRYWKGGSFQSMPYTSNLGDRTPHPLADMIGLTKTKISQMDTSNVPGGTFSNKLHPSRALVNWLYGFDHSYRTAAQTARKSMLADFGRSGVVIVKKPTPSSNLPGFQAWAQANQNIPTRVFAQTNDGVLHVINPRYEGMATGALEEMAIVPPSVLLPHRLVSTKFTENAGRLRWLDINDSPVGGDNQTMASNPLYLLDGPMRLWYFDIGGWGAYLMATLGRGGNGFYTMNVSRPNNPKFYWYRETLDTGDGGVTLLRMDESMDEPVALRIAAVNWSSVLGNPDEHPWRQIGFDNPRLGTGIAKLPGGGYQNILVLAGGMMRNLNVDDNGKMGATLHIIDPNVAKQKTFDGTTGGVKVFNGGSLKETSWRVGKAMTGTAPFMGMMTSEPTLLAAEGNSWLTDRIMAMDNRGNVFEVSTKSGSDDVSMKDWRIRTVATLRSRAQAENADSYAMPYRFAVRGRTKSDPSIWLAGGTADVGTRDNVMTGPFDDTARLRNQRQMVFSFSLTVAESGSGTVYRDDMQSIDPEQGSSSSSSPRGWYMFLKNPVDEYGAEYASAQPVVMNGVLYVATFIPRHINPTQGSCDDNRIAGTSRLYALNVKTGKAERWKDGKKYISLAGTKINSLSLSRQGGRDSLIVVWDVLDKTLAEQAKNDVIGKKDAKGIAGMTNALNIPGLPTSSPVDLKDGKSMIYNWFMKN